jgi:hypothetical protein
MPITLLRIPMSVLAAALLLAGCDHERSRTWRATGVNNANLGAMLADPSHATHGVAAQGERSQPGNLAIQRLEQGRRPALPDSRAARGVGAATPPPAMQPPGATNVR